MFPTISYLRGVVLTATTLLLAQPAAADLVILQYHHVSDATPPSTSTSRSLFRAQLDMIEQLELEVVSLESGTRAALAGELNDTQQIAITFDDAYSSVLTHAAPLLVERNLPFTMFVNTAAVGRNGYLTWEQLASLGEQPGVTIANHSEDHGHLARQPGETVETWRARATVSLDTAQDTLATRLGEAPPLFAYPYGEFSAELEALVAERGWYGYGQQSGAAGTYSSPTRLPRFPMANTYGQLNTLRNKLLSLAFPVDNATLPDGILDTNPPTLALSLPDNLDVARLTCFASGQGRIEVTGGTDRQRVEVQAPGRFHSRRFRYNCTYPAGNGRYYWLSQQWLDQSQPPD